MTGNATFVAGGNITPSRFVKLSTTADNTVLQAGAGERCIGVSQQGTRNPPYGALDDGFCAIASEELRVFQDGEICPLTVGAAVTRGDRLKSDANGKGITAAANDPHYAIALQSGGGDGELIEVKVDLQYFSIGAS